MVKIGQREKSETGGKGGFSLFQVIILVCLAVMGYSSLHGRPIDWQLNTSASSKSWEDKATSIGTTEQLINPLSIRKGQAQNLPSVRVEDEQLDSSRAIYGGKGDKKHLGGFTAIDMHGISPAVWKHAVQNWTAQSALDVGCGRGISTSWFYTHGLRVQCVEGSHDAIEKSMVPDKSLIVEHDFSRGPWWPGDTFDIAWSVEFLEHVNLQFHYNYVSALRKAAIIMVTSSRWGGWHHVEVHPDEWWIQKYEAYGFRYSEKLTKEIRSVAQKERQDNIVFPPNGELLMAQHVFSSMKVFLNPTVSALPEHAHLFAEHGCFTNYNEPNHKCGVPVNPKNPRNVATAKAETPLDPSFLPLELTPEQDEAWYKIVKDNIPPPEPKKEA